MALVVQMRFDVNGSNDKTWTLMVDKIQFSQDRLVTQAPLPAGESDSNSQTFTLDLGMQMPRYNISGILNTTSSDGGTNDPSKETFEDTIVDTWNGLTYLIIPGRTYVGVVKSCTYTLTGALEDRWLFDLLFYNAGVVTP